jgi:hypothetical protein
MRLRQCLMQNVFTSFHIRAERKSVGGDELTKNCAPLVHYRCRKERLFFQKDEVFEPDQLWRRIDGDRKSNACRIYIVQSTIYVILCAFSMWAKGRRYTEGTGFR